MDMGTLAKPLSLVTCGESLTFPRALKGLLILTLTIP